MGLALTAHVICPYDIKRDALNLGVVGGVGAPPFLIEVCVSALFAFYIRRIAVGKLKPK
jgi:hypothetical protein